MIYFIIGASGSGKTACMQDIQKLLPEYTVFDFDDIGVPDGADKKWRQEATEQWIKKINDEKLTNVCLLGQMVLGEIVAAPSSAQLSDINIILLDCDDLVRIKRLKSRNTYGANQDILNWSAWLRVHCHDPQWAQHVLKDDASNIMQFDRWDAAEAWSDHINVNVIDTTQLSIAEVAKQVADLIAQNSKTSA